MHPFDGKKTYFIDWEAAGQEDPFFDIATVCNEFIANESDLSYFLSQYFNGEPTAYQQAKVFGMRQISYCYLALHFLEHAANAGLTLEENYNMDEVPSVHEWVSGYFSGKYQLANREEFLLYAMTKIKASSAQMRSEAFNLLLDELNSSKIVPKMNT